MHRGVTVWFTGIPCCGKTTIANRIAEILRNEGYKTERLDGDIVRKNLSSDLGFSKKDRNENIKRVTFVAKLLTRNGVVVLATFVSPYIERRQITRESIVDFIEVYVKAPLEVCMERDIKGMYKKALAGEIKNFTGVDDPYEEPINPELVLYTDKESIEESTQKVLDVMKKYGYYSPN